MKSLYVGKIIKLLNSNKRSFLRAEQKMVVSRPFPHLSNTLHQLGHELHMELTEDICRRNAAKRFENKLEIPINRAKMERISTGVATFPYHSKLAPQCGDCAVLTLKKPIERLRGPPPSPRRRRRQNHQSSAFLLQKSKSSSVIHAIKRKKSMISVTSSSQKFQYYHMNTNGGQQQRRRRQYNRIQKMPEMRDSSTQTDSLLLNGKRKTKKLFKKEVGNERIDLTKNDTVAVECGGGGDQIDENFSFTESGSHSMFGKYEKKFDGKRQLKHQKIGDNRQPKKKEEKIVSTKNVSKEIVKKEEEKPQKKARKCSIPAAEDAIPRIPREQQLYAPIELHCATESAVKAVDRTVNALEKLILLAPNNSIEKSLMKTISLMCVFLRQFHTELRTRKDRRSKLEIILKLWTELQKQSTQGNPINIPTEAYQPSSAAETVIQQPPPPSIKTNDITVKTNTVSPTTTTSTSTLNIFVQKKMMQQKSKLS